VLLHCTRSDQPSSLRAATHQVHLVNLLAGRATPET
jgi:hypothetical protein